MYVYTSNIKNQYNLVGIIPYLHLQCSQCIFSFIQNFGNVHDVHSFPFKMFLLLATRNLFHSECSQCSRHTFTLYCTLHLTITIMYCSYIYNEVLSCIFKLNMKKYKHNYFFLLWRNANCYEEKSYHYQIYHCLKVKPSFHEKLFLTKKLLLWLYAQQLSGHLWFNGWQKSLVAGLK